MKRLQKAALLTALAGKLLERGGRCGETQLQKATYFLQDLLAVPLEFRFILYKYGPFSFDLRDEITAMRADCLLDLRPERYPYGTSLAPTRASAELRKRFPKTLERYERELNFIAQRLGGRKVIDLEQLATALYVWRKSEEASPEKLASLIHDLKPHVSINEGMSAVREVTDIRRAANALEEVTADDEVRTDLLPDQLTP